MALRRKPSAFTALQRAVRARARSRESGASLSSKRQLSIHKPTPSLISHAGCPTVSRSHTGVRHVHDRTRTLFDDRIGSNEPVHPGAVHVKIHPRPQSLAESAQVLAQLRRFGEVEMFQHLKYSANAPAPNSAIAIFRSPDAAIRATRASPIEFTLNGASDGPEGELKEPKRREEIAAQIDEPIGMEHEEAEAAVEYAPEDEATLWDAEPEDLDMPTELDEARSLVTPGDAEVFPPHETTAIQPPWEMMDQISALTSRPARSSPALAHESDESPPAAAPIRPVRITIDPSRPIALPELAPAPRIHQPPAYRYSNLSAGARRTVASPPPAFAPLAPRDAIMEVQASGLAHRFYSMRQPYFSSFVVKENSYPGEGMLGELPPGLHGVRDSDVWKEEVSAGQRVRKEQQVVTRDRFEGQSLREVWEMGQEARKRRARGGEDEGEWMSVISRL